MEQHELGFMKRSIELSKACQPIAPHIPRVGAVIAVNGKIIAEAGRGSGREKDDEHAEHNALHAVTDKTILPECTLYTTLEPCTRAVRKRPLECCTELILQHKFKKVWYGVLDPNQGVTGKGVGELEGHNIQVEQFPWELRHQIHAMNAEFERFQRRPGVRISSPNQGGTVEIGRNSDGGLYGRVKVTCKCAEDPDASIGVLVQHGAGWWPSMQTLHRTGEGSDFEIEVSFGSVGTHTIHIVKMTECGADLVSYYKDVVTKNEDRKRKIIERLTKMGVKQPEVDALLKGLPGSYPGIKMGRLPKGLESLADVTVEVVEKK